MTVDGQNIGADQGPLKAALEQADLATVDVEAEADAPSSLVLAALTLSGGPHLAQRSLDWQGLKLVVTSKRSTTLRAGRPIPASIISWRGNGATHLWSISAGPALANLGPHEPGDEKTEPAVISNMKKACASDSCSLDVELREEHLRGDLQGWQRVVAAVGAHVELHVRPAAPPPKDPNVTHFGRLPPEVIQTVVRRNFHLFKGCYEDGLRRNPNLEGRISASFVIERDGSVKSSSDGGSDIPDAAVRDCVVRTFVGLKFPPPESGIVTVVYPIMLAPG